MLNNYLKIAIRNLLKHKGYSFINIAGLAVGLACGFYILYYIQFELSYDRYQKDYERIYRICQHKVTESRDERFAGCSDMVAPTIKQNFIEAEKVTRVALSRAYTVRYQERVFFEDKINAADPDVFDIFNINFIEGDPLTALNRPGTAVLTKEMAVKYFGDENPYGKTINIIQPFTTTGIGNYEITGVIENPPDNTHWHYGIISSFITIENEEWMHRWDGSSIPTYVKLAPGYSVEDFENRISQLPSQYIGEQLKEKKTNLTLFLQPLKNIHLYSNLTWEMEPSGNPLYLYIFSGVGVLILLIACMNFMNLTTARAANRAGEVGIRKVVGAHRHNLFWQFMGESVIISLISMVGALLLVDLTAPWFNNLVGYKLTITSLFQPDIILKILVVTLIAGCLAGCYPAFFHSSFSPARVLKGSIRTGSRGALLRKILVVGQFTISIILIAGTLIVYKQINFMKDYSLGFNKEQKLIIGLDLEALNDTNYETVKNEFLQNPSITGATVSSSIPGRWMYRWRVWPSGEETTKNQAMNFFQVDYDFIKTYQLEIIAGQPFQKDVRNGYIINEAAVKKFGWTSLEEALEKTLFDERRLISGVMKDFHFRGLQQTVEPLIIFLIGDDFKYLTLTVNTTALDKTVDFVRNKYQTLFPDKPCELFFLDADFDMQYRTETRLGKIFSIFTLLGLMIAGLGLFGLASFITQQRTREIGIRKVLGASVSNVVTLLSREFLLLVIGANLLAWPVAYLLIDRWLQDFAYRTGISWHIFISAGMASIIIAMLTVSFQAVKSALANPVDSLWRE